MLVTMEGEGVTMMLSESVRESIETRWYMMSTALGYSECTHCHAFTDDMYYCKRYGVTCYGCLRTGQYA